MTHEESVNAYRNSPRYKELVDWMAGAVINGSFTGEEMEAAAVLAHSRAGRILKDILDRKVPVITDVVPVGGEALPEKITDVVESMFKAVEQVGGTTPTLEITQASGAYTKVGLSWHANDEISTLIRFVGRGRDYRIDPLAFAASEMIQQVKECTK